jgi:hypothetical protein
MTTRNFALIMGIAFLLVGILGFIPGITVMHDDPIETEGLRVGGPGHGQLLGLFHVNLLHNIVHLLFGIMGIAMARTYPNARLYARIVAITYGLLVILGLLPDPFNTLFGLCPIHGHDVWLHALIALAAAYFGFVVPATEMATDTHTSAGTERTERT